MKNQITKMLALCLVIAMIFSVISIPAYAQMPTETESAAETESTAETESMRETHIETVVETESDVQEGTEKQTEAVSETENKTVETEAETDKETENVITEVSDNEVIYSGETQSESLNNPLLENEDEESAISTYASIIEHGIGVKYYLVDSKEEAIKLLREALVNHDEIMVNDTSIVHINIAIEASDSSIINEIFWGALEHTGNANEGAYLNSIWKHADTPYGVFDGVYYISYSIEFITTKEQENEFKTKANEVLNGLNLTNKTDYEKVKIIYDYICSNVQFDYEHEDDYSYKLKYTPYAALINKKAVCQGYATLFYYMALKAGVDCRNIRSNQLAHEWNIVKIGSMYYYLDATWDAANKAAAQPYEYFLKGSQDFADHENTDDDFTDGAFASKYILGGHAYTEGDTHVHSYTITTVQRTCTTKGYTLHTCDCGFSYKDNYVDATGHDYYLLSMSSKTWVCRTCGNTSFVPPINTIRVVFSAIGTETDDVDVLNDEMILTDGTFYVPEVNFQRNYSLSSFGMLGSPIYDYYGTILYGEEHEKLHFDIAPIRQKPVMTEGVVDADGTTLTWEQETGAYGYEIYRKTKGGSFTLIKTFDNNTTTQWTDTTAKTGSSYVYSIKAYTFTKQMVKITTDYSDELTPHAPWNPIDISGFKAVFCTTEKIIIKNLDEIVDYVILIDEKNNKIYDLSKWIKFNGMGRPYTPVTINGEEWYDMYGFDTTLIGYDGFSGTLKVNINCIKETPNFYAPSDTKVDGAIYLSWVKETGALGYEIYRCDYDPYHPDADRNYSLLTTINDSSICEYYDTSILNKEWYIYYIRTYTKDKNGNKVYSEISRERKGSSDSVSAHTHTIVTLPAKAASCTESGLTEGSTCSVCGTVIKAQEVIPALGHKAVVTKSGKAASCTSTGLTDETKCSVCGALLTAQTIIPKTSHKEVSIPAKAATCQATGLTEGKKCSVCGEILVAQQVTPKTDHTPEIMPAKAATCTATGLTEGKKCSVCGTIIVAQQVIPSKGGHVEVVLPAKAATCTETGLTEGKQCSVCHEILTAQTVIPALGHVEETAITKATLLNDGRIVTTCSRCHATVSDTVIAYPKTIALQYTSVGYNGKAFTPGVTVTGSNGKAIDRANFDVTYANNVNIGKATVTVTFKGDYYEGQKSLTFTIYSTNNTITAGNFTKAYSTKAQSFSIGAKVLDRAGLSYSSNNKSITVDRYGKVTIAKKYIGKATITIKAAATSKYTAATKNITVTVNPTGTSLSSVADTKDGKATVKWKKNTVGAGYQIQYATASNFSSNVKTVTVGKNKTTSGTISGLAHGKKYYVRIRTYKKVGSTTYYSGWSGVKNVSINLNPASTKLSSVKNGSRSKMTVKWRKQSKASGYFIQYSTDSRFAKNVSYKYVNSAKTTSTTLSGLKKGSRYYVRIRTYKTVGGTKYYSGWSSVKNVVIKK